MAHLPPPTSAYHVFAQKYIERCKQVQKLANLHPAYEHRTFPVHAKPSAVIVLDDDDPVQVQVQANNTQSSTLFDLLTTNSTTNQTSSTNLQRNSSYPEQSTDLHITGVSVLREWIDISELDVETHLNSDVQQAQNCDLQKREETQPRRETILEKSTTVEAPPDVETHLNSDVQQAQNCDLHKREETQRRTETIPKKSTTVEGPQIQNQSSNKRKEDRRHHVVSTTTEKEDLSKRFTSDNCSETIPWTKSIVTPHIRNELLKKGKEDDVRALRSRLKRPSTTETENSAKRRRTRKEIRFNFEDGEDSCHEPDEDWMEMDEEEESDEVEDVLTNVKEKFVKKKKKVKVRRKQRRKSVLQEDTNTLNSISEETMIHGANDCEQHNQLPVVTEQPESILTEEEKKDHEESGIVEEKIDVSENMFFHEDKHQPSTTTEQSKESIFIEETQKLAILDAENKEDTTKTTEPIVEVKEDVSESNFRVDQEQAEPIPDKKEEVPVIETPGEENAKPEDPEVEILGDNWADLNVVEVISSEEEEETTQKVTEKYKCDQCTYRTNWKSNLSKHIVSRHQTSSEIKWFECAHCPYRGKTREYLRSHLRQTHEQFITWYNCTKCHLKFKAKQFLEYHVLAVHTAPEDIQWFKCDQCDFKCRVKIRLKEHKLNKHTSADEIKWYNCKVCKYKGKTKKALSRHEKNKHVEYDEMEWFKCDKCDYEGTDRLYLRKHVKTNHPEVIQMEREDISEKQLECKMCGVKMFSKSKFLEHFRWSKDCYF